MSAENGALSVQLSIDNKTDVEAGGPKSEKAEAYKKSASFASAGMRIIFKDLDYMVMNSAKKGEKLFLLKGVSGYFEPGQMAALMGPSGSGKTTLLDVLAGRKTAGKQTGIIHFAGQTPSTSFLRRYTGYVEQFDTLLGILTVREMLLYTAELKRPISESYKEKAIAVDELLQRLGLMVCKDVKIGNSMMKGISGGQAKRTNIGLALITHPRVLFLDEPTSGLDSYTSNEVMKVVKSLVSDGTTICATIHSPTSFAFSLFDRLIMLVRGQVVYFGKQGRSAIDFTLSICSDVKQYTEGYNDAEFLVDFITEADQKGFGHKLADHYANSELARTNMESIDMYEKDPPTLPEHLQKELAVKRDTVTPWWWALKTLIKYRTSKNYRDGEFLGPRIGDKLLIGLLIMTLYLNIGKKYVPDNYVNIAAVLFMWVTLPAFGAAAYVPALVLERSLFTRERSDGLYYVFTYLLAKMFDELMIACISSLCVASFVFYGVDLQGQWVLFWLVYYITLCNGVVLAYWIAALSPNMDVANAVLPTYVVSLLFFAGFLFRYDNMPPWWKWYSYIDLMRYSWGAVMINQFDGKLGDPIFQGSSTVLETFGLKGLNKWRNTGFTALFFIVYFFLAYITMSYKRYSSR